MPRYVVGRAADFPPGTQRLVHAGRKPIAVFNVSGTLRALVDTCPHRGGSLAGGRLVGRLASSAPGEYDYEPSCALVKCPWHGWEFDLETGQSWLDPSRMRVRSYEVGIESGARIAGMQPGPYVAETVVVRVEDDYVVLETG